MLCVRIVSYRIQKSSLFLRVASSMSNTAPWRVTAITSRSRLSWRMYLIPYLRKVYIRVSVLPDSRFENVSSGTLNLTQIIRGLLFILLMALSNHFGSRRHSNLYRITAIICCWNLLHTTQRRHTSTKKNHDFRPLFFLSLAEKVVEELL